MLLAARLLKHLALPLILFAVWWIGSAGSQNFYFPSLSKIMQTFGIVWGGERLTHDVIPSLSRLAAGYGLAVIIAVGLGTGIGLSQRTRNILEPVLEFLRAVPPSVLVPIFLIVFGIGDLMKILVILFGCIWPILLNTVEGVRSRDEVMGEVARICRLNLGARLVHFVLPAASPMIFTGLRQSLSIAIILMVISEMFAASNGIGFSVVQFQRTFAIPEMWTGIMLLGLIGVLLSLLFQAIEHRVLSWYFGMRLIQRGNA